MQRTETLEALKSNEFDLVVIGGGATGSGIALDAASRGLSVALLEKNDFSEGTSSRSTKLVHGGVRYLELAIKRLDKVQYNLVRDGLRERGLILENAAHLAHKVALVTPLYKWWEMPYIYAGLCVYDLLSGKRALGRSRLLSRKEALRRFPMLNAEGLKGGVLYYDGQFNDARMNVSLVLTAEEQGAVTANHVGVVGLLKNDQQQVCGVEVVDQLTEEPFTIRSRGVINATGPFIDHIRRMDQPEAASILHVSSGIHIVLDRRFAPPDTGLMIPKTDDGRVLFVLPWEGHALVGTTDEEAQLADPPVATDDEVDYLLRHVGRYFNLKVDRSDIKAVWSGLRPLVSDPDTADTAKLARDHYVEISAGKLLTISGGKWTTYRKMALDAVDQAIDAFSLQPERGCCTEQIPIVGGTSLKEARIRLEQVPGLSAETIDYLLHNYGDRAADVAVLAADGYSALLVEGHPYIEAEVVYAVRAEQAQRPLDILVRRMPLGLVDTAATQHSLDRVIALMTAELGWSDTQARAARQEADERLDTAI